jgi:hypothetical protein
MSEGEWNASQSPAQMLEFVFGKASRRKYRLFACACCRLIEDLLTDEGNYVVQAAERFADGDLEEEELRAVWTMACDSGCEIATVAAVGSEASAWHVAHQAAFETARMAAARNFLDLPATQRRQCVLMRDLFGALLFRPIVPMPEWVAGTPLIVARSIYEERRFETLPILADALEENGCTEAEVLEHLRGPGPHVRGCWAVDLILGRQ